MSRAKPLFDLQQVDLLHDAATARLARVNAAMGSHPQVAQARARLEQGEQAMAGIERRLSQRQQERGDLAALIAREESRLYSGAVKAPREVQNLQREVESLKRRLGTIEDALLEVMVVKEEADTALGEARTALAEAEDAAADHLAALAEEKAKLEAALRRLRAQRAQVQTIVRADDRVLYDRLRAAKGGRAVAELKDGTCGACGIQLPAGEASRALSAADFVYCRGCGRILHR